MSTIQKIITSLVPASWARSMEAESRDWMARCTCGFERSIWEIGGIRWKAAGSPRRRLQCPQCGQSTWHTVYRKTADD